MNEIISVRELGRLLGVSVSTAHAYLKRPDLPAKFRNPKREDLDEFRDWIARVVRHGDDRDLSDGFWDHRTPYPPLPPLLEPDGIIPLAPEKLPPLLVGDFEREVLAGKRKLSAAEGEAVLASALDARVRIAALVSTLPAWLVGHGTEEIAARLRFAIVHLLEDAGRALENIADGSGVDNREELRRDAKKKPRLK